MVKLSICPNTPIRLERKDTQYLPGSGSQERWIPITRTSQGVESAGFLAQWKGAFGADMASAAAQNIRQMATVRMAYHPEVWKALRYGEVRVYLEEEGEKANPFLVYGDADNMNMENQIIEFKVHRLEVK